MAIIHEARKEMHASQSTLSYCRDGRGIDKLMLAQLAFDDLNVFLTAVC